MAQLNPCTEHACQILYECAEIDPAVSRKIEQDFAVVKRILHVDELHLKLMGGNFLFTDGKGFLLPAPVFFYALQILACRLADELFQRMDDFLVRDFAVFRRDKTAFHTARRFHDNRLAFL